MKFAFPKHIGSIHIRALLLSQNGTRNMRSTKICSRGGLTLIEAVIVIAIVGIITAMLLPTLAASRSRSRRMQCAHNLKNLGEAMATFSVENSGTFPDAYYHFSGLAGTYDLTLRDKADSFFKYVDTDALQCPFDSEPRNIVAKDIRGADITARTSYAYNVALPTMYRNLSRISRSASIVSFYDGDATAVVDAGAWSNAPGWSTATISKRHHNSANFLFIDGHVEELPGIDESLAFNDGGKWTASALDTTPRVDPVTGLVAPSTLPKLPALPLDIGLFGDFCVILGTGASIDVGLASNGFVQLGNGAQVADIKCGGPLTAGSSPLINGNIITGDSVAIAGVVTGSINSAGNVSVDGATGDISADGNITITEGATGALYSGGDIVVDVATGRIIAAGDVTIGDSASGNVDAGGNMTAGDASGDIICGGNATVNGTAGSIQAGGNVTANVASAGVISCGNVVLQGASTGNVEAGGAVTIQDGLSGSVKCLGLLTLSDKEILNGSAVTGGGALIGEKAEVTGNLSANGNVNVAKQGKIDGNVQYTGNLVLASGAKILGTKTKVPPFPVTPATPAAPLAPPSPVGFSPVALPSATKFTTGGDDIIENNQTEVNLDPGSYGDLNLGTKCTLRLSGGAYYFDSFTVDNNLSLSLDCDGTNIQIYVKGNVSLGTMSSLSVSGGGPRNVFIESHGNFSTVNGTRWEGTVFVPSGDITLSANCNIKGSLFCGGTLTLGNGVIVQYVPPAS